METTSLKFREIMQTKSRFSEVNPKNVFPLLRYSSSYPEAPPKFLGPLSGHTSVPWNFFSILFMIEVGGKMREMKLSESTIWCV